MFNSIFTETITMPEFLVALCSAMVLGVLNALVFRFKTKQSSGFTLTVALIPMVVTFIIMLVNGNIGTGVAVAGTFALVRFRSLPGNAKEIAGIFASVALGLGIGTGYVGISVIFFGAVTVFVLALTAIGFGKDKSLESAWLLKVMIPENYNYEGLFDEVFEKYTNSFKLERVKTANMGTLFEISYVIELKDEKIPKEFIDEIRKRNGNLNVVINPVVESTEVL